MSSLINALKVQVEFANIAQGDNSFFIFQDGGQCAHKERALVKIAFYV